MQSLESLFRKSKGQPIEFEGQTVQLIDDLAIGDLQRMRLTFLSTNSNWRQGVHLSSDGTILVNGKEIKKAVVLWEDTAPRQVDLVVKSKSGRLFVKNVWDSGNGMQFWHAGAGMIVGGAKDCRVYRCNDGELDTDFDDLIFELRSDPAG